MSADWLFAVVYVLAYLNGVVNEKAARANRWYVCIILLPLPWLVMWAVK